MKMKPMLFTALLGVGGAASAAPFEDCPTQAFLMQGKPAQFFGVDVSTGYYWTLAETLQTVQPINGIGFNTFDNYFYGWNKEHKTIVQIGDDYIATPLPQPEGLPAAIQSKGFYIGDVALAENVYYAFRPGSGLGLYKVPLDPEVDNYLVAEKVIGAENLNWTVYDMAFHPEDGFLYSVDRNGRLWKVSSENGSSEVLIDFDVSGTFGAVYFDLEGNLYFSRNKDGHIFRTNVNDETPSYELYAYGPKSGQNDGARCATAPVTSTAIVTNDYGDAPESYGTLHEDNGPRHNTIGNDLFLGELRDVESDAYPAPNADDYVFETDEDGVQFVTPFSAGDTALIKVTSSGSGVVSMWVDWNGNGVFDNSDAVGDVTVRAGSQFVGIPVPPSAVAGTTWARFRLSEEGAIGPHGGAATGEVEDYEITIEPCDCSTASYPSAGGWVTLAYEDLWPAKGDFDMNDVVVYYRSSALKTASDNIVSFKIEGELAAFGARYHNGFAVNIPGVTRDQINEDGIVFRINDVVVDRPSLEEGLTEAVIVISDDVWDDETPMEECSFFRTQLECDDPIDWTFSVTVPLNIGIAAEQVGSLRLDPFIFGASGHERNERYQPADFREMEVHLKNKLPTTKADPQFLGMDADSSIPAGDNGLERGYYYLQSNGLPFALEIEGRWQHPLEGIDVVEAYPEFVNFVLSLGEESKDWHTLENAAPGKVYPH